MALLGTCLVFTAKPSVPTLASSTLGRVVLHSVARPQAEDATDTPVLHNLCAAAEQCLWFIKLISSEISFPRLTPSRSLLEVSEAWATSTG